MKTKLIVFLVGLLSVVAGLIFRARVGYGPESLMALCGMLEFTFISGALLCVCEKGRYAVQAYCLFLVACTSLIGFIL